MDIKTEAPETPTVAPPASFPMLVALNRTGKHIYGGTVAPAVKAKRRAANKVARAQRRTNRAA